MRLGTTTLSRFPISTAWEYLSSNTSTVFCSRRSCRCAHSAPKPFRENLRGYIQLTGGRNHTQPQDEVESKEEVGSDYKLLETGLKDNVLRPGLPLTTFMSLGRQLLHKHDRDRAGADCAVCLGGEDEDDEEEAVAIGADATASLASEGAYKRKVLEMLTLPCGHLFHTVCAARWFHRDASCPTCRRQVASLADRSVTIQIVAGALKSAKSLGVFAGSMIKAVCHPVARLLLPRKGRGGGWVLAMLPLLSKKAA
jgi:hypothetical protein